MNRSRLIEADHLATCMTRIAVPSTMRLLADIRHQQGDGLPLEPPPYGHAEISFASGVDRRCISTFKDARSVSDR